MTPLAKVKEEKRKHLNKKPTLDTPDILRFQSEIAEWDNRLRELNEKERELETKSQDEMLDKLGQIANKQKQRYNRLQTIDMLKGKYKQIGLDRRYSKANKKELQWNICLKIVEYEEQLKTLATEIEVLIDEQVNGLK